MQGLNINTVSKACHGKVYGNTEGIDQLDFTGVVIDSRKIEEGNLFIATKGERVDGHSFIHEAFQKGCKAIVCEVLPEIIEGPCILVEDSFEALRKIATYYRSTLHIKVVGITGSVGKTSTKEAVAAVLKERYSVRKTEGNFNNEIGLPLTILSIRKMHEIAVLEMGINHFGEMKRLSEIAKPDLVVITNIGPCHLEFLEDLDGVFRAKTEIFESMNPQGICCLNGDDSKLTQVKEVHGKKPMFYGFSSKCDVTASKIVSKGLLGTTFVLHYFNESADVHIKIPGEHMVDNALCAATVGNYFGLSIEEVVRGIESIEPVKGRSRIVDTGKFTIIDDCYNANPVSVVSAVHLLETAKGRKVAILGDMFELGENTQELHAQVGRSISKSQIDVLVCIGTLSKEIYENAKKGNIKCLYFETKDGFFKEIGSILCFGDTVLIKASNGMKFSTLVDLCIHPTWI